MAQPLTRPEVVVFDLGNVFALHDNEKLMVEMGRLFGVDAATVRARVPAEVWEHANIGKLPGDTLRQKLCSTLGATVSAADFERVWSCHFTIHEEQVTLAEKLLGRVPLVLLSNTHDLHFGYLAPRLPVLQRFQALVLSYQVEAMKPDVRIYQAAVAKAGVPAEKTVFFDDVQAYVEGARAAGMQARLFTTAAQCAKDLADLGL